MNTYDICVTLHIMLLYMTIAVNHVYIRYLKHKIFEMEFGKYLPFKEYRFHISLQTMLIKCNIFIRQLSLAFYLKMIDKCLLDKKWSKEVITIVQSFFIELCFTFMSHYSRHLTDFKKRG